MIVIVMTVFVNWIWRCRAAKAVELIDAPFGDSVVWAQGAMF